MLTRERMDVGRMFKLSRELQLIRDIAAVHRPFGYGLMGLFGRPPLLDAE